MTCSTIINHDCSLSDSVLAIFATKSLAFDVSNVIPRQYPRGYNLCCWEGVPAELIGPCRWGQTCIKINSGPDAKRCPKG